MKKILSLALLLGLLLAMLLPLTAGALVSHEVSAATNYLHPDGRNVIFAQGVYWAFYGHYYSTSLDNGVTWGNETDLTAGNVTFSGLPGDLSVSTDASSTYVYISSTCYWAGNIGIAFRMGEIFGNGTITWQVWDDVVQDVTGHDNFYAPNVAVDGSGHYWIGYYEYEAYTYNISFARIVGSSTTNGVWTTDAAKTLSLLQVSGNHGGACVPIGLASTAAIIYAVNNGQVYARIWDLGTSAWGTAVHSDGHVITTSLTCLSAVGDDYGYVQIAYLKTSSYDIVYTWYDSAANIMGWDSTIVPSVTSTSAPCISRSTVTRSLYVWWAGSPLANHLYYIKRSVTYLTWGYPVDLGAESAGLSANYRMNAIYQSGEDALSILYDVAGGPLRFNRLYGNETSSTPYGVTLEATGVGATELTLNGLCTWSGGSGAMAEFVYRGVGMYTDTVVVHSGNVTSSEYFSDTITGLVPDTLYWYWIVLTNDSGSYFANVIFVMTLATAEFSAPIVITTAPEHITDTSARINGALLYDGKLECFGGFDWRVLGSSTWTRNWYAYTNTWPFSGLVSLRSPATFSGTLSNLARNTTYEYRALAKNSLTEPGVVYGNVTSFMTLYAMGPTSTPSGGIGIPPAIGDFFKNLSSSVKLIFAIVVNVLAVIVVVWFLRSSKGVGIAALVTGLGLVILFTVIGWYPMWIIMLIGAIVGLLVFLILLGKR